MGLEGGPRLMKIALILFNALVLIAGSVALGLGVWSLKSDFGAQEMSSLSGSKLYEAACIVVISASCLVILLSLLGCCGAVMENRVLLSVFASILIILLVVFAVGAVIVFVYKGDIEEELEKEMTRTLKEKYGIDTDTSDDNLGVTDVWNKIQKELKCCGVSGGLRSNTSWFLWQQSKWFKSQLALEKDYVPNSCCNIDDNYTFNQCTKINSNSSLPVQEDFIFIKAENPALFSDGCIDKVKDKIENHVVAIAVAAVIVLIVMLLSITFALCVYVQIGRQNLIV